MTNPNNIGHRSRLRKKFLINQDSILDYELLEILLFSAHPRRDTKQISKDLLKKFGDINSIFNADENLLKEINNIGDSSLVSIKLAKEIIVRYSKNNISNKIIINNWQSMIDYCQKNIGNLKNENLHILFLDKKYRLISDRIYGELALSNNISVSKNEIIKNALNLSSSYVILSHNHPSGDPKPSKIDISNTKNIENALKHVDIKLLDHIIIASDKYYSFQQHNLL
jgi:DNA repair protein RadC